MARLSGSGRDVPERKVDKEDGGASPLRLDDPPSPTMLTRAHHPIHAHFGPFLPGGVTGVPEAGTLAAMIRVLVTLSPRMYRQVIALSIQRGRPGLVDLRLAPPEAMEEAELLASFRPHLLVCNDASGDSRNGAAPIPEATLEAVGHPLKALYSDGMDARISADGVLTELPDGSTDDLLAAVDAAGLLADREESPG
jgi:hypothetical protein